MYARTFSVLRASGSASSCLHFNKKIIISSQPTIHTQSEGAPKDTAKEVLEKGLELVLARKAVATERIASKTEALVEIEARLREVSNEFKEAKKDEAGAKQALKILERNEQELLAALEQLNS